MTAEGYRAAIVQAVDASRCGEARALELLVQVRPVQAEPNRRAHDRTDEGIMTALVPLIQGRVRSLIWQLRYLAELTSDRELQRRLMRAAALLEGAEELAPVDIPVKEATMHADDDKKKQRRDDDTTPLVHTIIQQTVFTPDPSPSTHHAPDPGPSSVVDTGSSDSFSGGESGGGGAGGEF